MDLIVGDSPRDAITFIKFPCSLRALYCKHDDDAAQPGECHFLSDSVVNENGVQFPGRPQEYIVARDAWLEDT